MNQAPPSAAALGKWWVCGLLLLAMMLNYMDRQTLSLTIVPIGKELGLSNTQYGMLEKGFSYAFAFGGLLAGWAADKIGIRRLYPLVLFAWSAMGIASGYADRIGEAMAVQVASWWPDIVDPGSPTSCAFLGFFVCRTALGFFESGQWPCALIATQRLLEPADRPLGNSLLQSGASVGAILTPLVVQALVTEQPGSWRGPFVVIGVVGMLWILAWTRLDAGARLDAPLRRRANCSGDATPTPVPRGLLVRRILALGVVVVAINLTWHFFRVWLPKMLEEFHGYEAAGVRYFTAAYYVATDLGCIAAGLAVKMLTARRMSVHAARLTIFLACALLTALSTVAAGLGHGPLLLILLLLLLIGFGSLGLFPNYYSLTQEISVKHQGKLTGALGCVTWVAIAEMQQQVGRHVDLTHSYADGIFWVGLAPAAAFVALCLLWGRADATAGVSSSRSECSVSGVAPIALLSVSRERQEAWLLPTGKLAAIRPRLLCLRHPDSNSYRGHPGGHPVSVLEDWRLWSNSDRKSEPATTETRLTSRRPSNRVTKVQAIE